MFSRFSSQPQPQTQSNPMSSFNQPPQAQPMQQQSMPYQQGPYQQVQPMQSQAPQAQPMQPQSTPSGYPMPPRNQPSTFGGPMITPPVSTQQYTPVNQAPKEPSKYEAAVIDMTCKAGNAFSGISESISRLIGNGDKIDQLNGKVDELKTVVSNMCEFVGGISTKLDNEAEATKAINVKLTTMEEALRTLYNSIASKDAHPVEASEAPQAHDS